MIWTLSLRGENIYCFFVNYRRAIGFGTRESTAAGSLECKSSLKLHSEAISLRKPPRLLWGLVPILSLQHGDTET